MSLHVTIPEAKIPVILGADGSPMRRTSFSAQDTAYRAASHTDTAMRGFHPPKGSADSDLLPEKDDIDVRARDVIRNEPVAKGGIDAQLELIIGTGVTVKPMPDHRVLGISVEQAEEWASIMKAQFMEVACSTYIDAARRNTLMDMLRLNLRTKIIQGEFAYLPLYLPDRPGAKFGTCIQAIDPDRCPSANDLRQIGVVKIGVSGPSLGLI